MTEDREESRNNVDAVPPTEGSRRLMSRINVTGYIGMTILVIHLLLVLFGPLLAPYPEAEILSSDPFSELGVLGSDYLGRDLLSRLLWGGRLTIGLALSATFLGFVAGICLGFMAAVAGGWVDQAISRANDVIMSFPSIMLALVVIVGLGSSVPVLIVTVAFVQTTRVLRVSRAVAMDVMVMDFVEVARARGEGKWWIMRREVLPNVIPPLAAEFGLRLTFSLLLISSLSFLGLGVQPPHAGWGIMVRENLSGLLFGSWAPIIPAAAICSLTIGINFLVDWMLGFSKRDIREDDVS
jgi:peptide/nickel transport system permease protein